MKSLILTTINLLLFFAFISDPAFARNQSEGRPNIIFIFADDLGYGDLGAYGQEKIETPNIDALADNGMKFTQHYSGSTVCAPARYSLMTGRHMGNAFVRGNDAVPEQNDVSDQYPEIVRKIEEIMVKARTTPEVERFRMSALGD